MSGAALLAPAPRRALDRTVSGGLKVATLAARVAAATSARVEESHPPPPRTGPLSVLMIAMYPAAFTGTKYRLAVWAERLRRRGFEVELALAMPDRHSRRLANDWSVRARAEFHLRMLLGRLASVRRANRFHTVIVHLNDLPFWDSGPPFVADALRRLAGRVLLDLDDLPLVAGRDELTPKARALGMAVDGLIIGNPALAAHYPDRPWWFVPTCVEPAEWRVPNRSARDGAPCLGWVGTPGNLRNLEPLAPAIAEVCRKHRAKLRVICSRPAELPGVPQEFVPWSPEREQADLCSVDIGLAPLVDSVKQRHTCGLKALQYMAIGAPVVASPVGALSYIVRDGETGLLATSRLQWVEALDQLLTDRVLRLRCGAAGRRDVEQRWCFEVHERSFEDALRGVRPHGG
jgi:glycosyltransferase involved in cell wall biosynthesis